MTEKELAIKLKIDKAKALMGEVQILIDNNFYNTAVSRMYYSCFHVTKALLLKKDLTPKTHSGVISNLHQHFVIKKEFDDNQAAFFSKLLKERIEDDYNDFIIEDFKEIKDYVNPAMDYVRYVCSLIEEKK